MKKSKLIRMMTLSAAVLVGVVVGFGSDAHAQLSGTGPQYLYKIVNVNSGKVLDVEHRSTENTYRILQWEYLGLPNQKWMVLPHNGSYYIVNLNSNKAIEPATGSGGNGARVWQFNVDYTFPRGQQDWFIEPVGNAYVIRNRFTFRVLDIEFNATGNGWYTHLWDYVPGIQSQLWRFERI